MVRCPEPMEAIHWQVSWIHGGNIWSDVLDGGNTLSVVTTVKFSLFQFNSLPA